VTWVIFIISVLVIVVVIFSLRYYAIWLADKRIAAFQNDLVVRYYNEVKNMYRDMRGWRHDYRTHIQTLKGYRDIGANEKVDEYLNMLDKDLTNVDTLISTGNITLNAILNSKLSLATSKNINVNAKVNVPETLPVSEIDLCVMIGNLLDNAVEACEKLKNNEKRFIRVYIDVKKSHLYISVTNATVGKSRKEGVAFKTEKSGFHGFGLLRIDRVVAKYGGYCYRAREDGAFTTEITVPL